MAPDKLKDLLDRYHKGQCTAEEKTLVEKWYQNIPTQEVLIPDGLQQKLWSSIRKQSNLDTSRKPFYLKIAASVVVLSLLSCLYVFVSTLKSSSNLPEQLASSAQLIPEVVKHTLNNDGTAPKEVVLEDGSIVRLQPNSSIMIPERFTPHERIVSLRGEAFFDIKRDTLRPFFVYSGEVVTKVLGTSFTIKALDFEKQIVVSVQTGKVSVFPHPKVKHNVNEIILTPNQQAVFNRSEIMVSKELVPDPHLVLEKPTLFSMDYDETPVIEIFKKLEENYGIDIQYQEETLKGCVLTTRMSDEGLFERIEVICKAINASYSIDNAVIHIEGKGCH